MEHYKASKQSKQAYVRKQNTLIIEAGFALVWSSQRKRASFRDSPTDFNTLQAFRVKKITSFLRNTDFQLHYASNDDSSTLAKMKVLFVVKQNLLPPPMHKRFFASHQNFLLVLSLDVHLHPWH